LWDWDALCTTSSNPRFIYINTSLHIYIYVFTTNKTRTITAKYEGLWEYNSFYAAPRRQSGLKYVGKNGACWLDSEMGVPHSHERDTTCRWAEPQLDNAILHYTLCIALSSWGSAHLIIPHILSGTHNPFPAGWLGQDAECYIDIL